MYWKDFKYIHQKGDKLGARISSVYNQLIDSGYNKVVLMGSDSPQLTSADYRHWVETKVKGQQVVMGPANDGGFYTFIGATKVDEAIWSGVKYSQSSTCMELDEKLTRAGFRVFYLNKQMDIDFYEDLEFLGRSLKAAKESTVENQALMDYIADTKLI